MKRHITLFVSIFTLVSNIYAQQLKEFNTISVGLDVSTNTFLGDIKQYRFYPSSIDGFSELGYSGSFNVKKTFDNVFAIKAEIGTGSLAGLRKKYASCDDCFSSFDPQLDSRHLKFLAKYTNYDLNLELNLSNLVIERKTKKQLPVKFFGEIGVGLLSFTSELSTLFTDELLATRGYENGDLDQKAPQTESYIKLGATALYQLNKRIDLSGKLKYYLIDTDKIDVVNASGRDLAGSIKDKFLSISVGVSYNIGSKNKAQHWHNPMSEIYSNQKTILKKLRGLTKDKDGDGVANTFDKHEDTPDGVAVDGSGTPLDTDRDGVFDYQDNDLFTSKNATVNAAGIESDKDGDGVPDSQDMEVSEKGSLVNYRGITIEGNSDISSSGIPSIHFATSSAKIRKDDFLKLAEVALIMQENPNDKFLVVGHADKRGASEYNQKLSEDRANIVARYLIDIFDVEESRLIIVSKGETSPVVQQNENNTAKSMYSNVAEYLNEMNRRVEFIKK